MTKTKLIKTANGMQLRATDGTIICSTRMNGGRIVVIAPSEEDSIVLKMDGKTVAVQQHGAQQAVQIIREPYTKALLPDRITGMKTAGAGSGLMLSRTEHGWRILLDDHLCGEIAAGVFADNVLTVPEAEPHLPLILALLSAADEMERCEIV